MITAAFGFNATMEGEAVNYVTIRLRRNICNKGNEQATPYVWARFAVCTEIITAVYGNHLIYEENTSLKTAQENYTTKGQLQWQYPIFNNEPDICTHVKAACYFSFWPFFHLQNTHQGLKISVELNSYSVAPGECKLQKDSRGQVVRPYSLISSHILAN
jgi:hypothetical protein